MKTIHVPILIETDEDGIFIVSCPQFRGCHTYGKTIDEALSRIKEVIEKTSIGRTKLCQLMGADKYLKRRQT